MDPWASLSENVVERYVREKLRIPGMVHLGHEFSGSSGSQITADDPVSALSCTAGRRIVMFTV